jgi:hypothetical protein
MKAFAVAPVLQLLAHASLIRNTRSG